ncbi:DUF664 domain-containing protein [Aquipuribacter hungaricus]|uniref:DUF664 domain-containing protein n=1 Tax=Aquipuribacter hungaricus TaxID=545624 RepID=A0ABV7WFE4_9MICO
MTDSRPWEPPLAGTDAEQLVGSLERLRTTFRWKADGLDRDGLTVRVGASTLTLGGLLKHLAAVEDEVFTWRLAGRPPVDDWPHDDPGWPFRTAADDEPDALYRRWDAAVARSRDRLAEALGAGDLDQPVHMADGDDHASLRRLLCDLLEEYGRHTGHADLLREAVDGRVGEDPPDGWSPVSG